MGKGLAAFFVPTANKLRVFVPSYEINADEEHYCSPPNSPSSYSSPTVMVTAVVMAICDGVGDGVSDGDGRAVRTVVWSKEHDISWVCERDYGEYSAR